jgi:acetyl-CoA C-acetyltransferase
MAGCIVGWAHTPFGKLPEEDVEGLIARVATQAVADAGIEPEDIGAVYLGVMNNGFSKQDFTAGMIAQADPRFRFTPATRLENACATGSAAIHAGLTYLAAKRGKFVLVVGAEKMTAKSVAEVSDILLGASYRREEAAVDGGFAGIFGGIAGAYFAAHGDQSDALARIAAKNHRNGVDNPYAQLRKDLGYEFCRTVSAGNPLVAGPLRRTDCSPISDGAAALVLADEETARGMRRAVRFRAAVQVNDYLPLSRRSQIAFEGAAAAWRQGFDEAGVALADLSFVETHDCFTIAELIEYEAMGLAPAGRGATVVEEGWTERDGRLPVNRSGGLKAKGHPIGATGVSMHAIAAMQLTGEAGPMQLPGARLGGVFNMGGAAVANYVSILERVK